MQSASSLRYLKNLPEPPEGALICVDLDGTLVRSDTLFESVTPLLRRGPLTWISMFLQLFRGRAAVKEYVASHGSPRAETLAWREELIEALQRWKGKGHELVLATASHLTTAEAVQAHLGLFDHVLGTEEGRNLRGHAKLAALKELAHDRPIWYLGDSSADLPLWKEVGGVAIAPFPGVARKVRKMPGVQVVEESRPSTWVVWSRALRIHQWVKNTLLFLPAALAHQIDSPEIWRDLLLAFFSFSFASSAVYMINDLLDLTCDRKHPIKKHRPLAAGWISPVHLFVAIPVAIGIAGGTAWFLHRPQFGAILTLYLVLTTLYSLSLKKYVAVDLLVLTSLYILRLFAGAATTGTPLSFWLIAFALFLFASLAILKRVTDLHRMQEHNRTSLDRRGYITDDLPTLRTLGIAAGIQSFVVLAFYMQSPHFRSLYVSPQFFWLVLPALFFWMIRMWIKTGRGEMLEDPVLFVLRDRWSWAIALLVIASTWLASVAPHSFWIEWIWR